MTDGRSRFVSEMTPPPGGKYFLEINGERVEATNWPEMHRKAHALMMKNGIVRPVAWVVAEYMCPFMPDWYCRGSASRVVVRDREAWNNAQQYFRRDLVTFDKVSERLRICADCPKHSREGSCTTCSGILNKILAAFGGRRPKVLEDKAAGVCLCARTYESVIASVEHGEDHWDGTPDGCWRNKK